MMRNNRRINRKFVYYSIYAWGMPIIWTVFAITVEKYKILPTNWCPSVGQNTCFFSSLCGIAVFISVENIDLIIVIRTFVQFDFIPCRQN